MTPELEVLDQLQGGDLPLEVVAKLFEERPRFFAALSRMIETGEVSLNDALGQVIPLWRFQEIARTNADLGAVGTIRVSLTEIGASRMS